MRVFERWTEFILCSPILFFDIAMMTEWLIAFKQQGNKIDCHVHQARTGLQD